jgi:hypothetical protein
MRRLIAFLAVTVVCLTAAAAFDWWVDPFGFVWKPGAVADARRHGCLISQELIGLRYPEFKLDVFRHRPTRTFVVGSSRVLKIATRRGDGTFSNLGYPGAAPGTVLSLFRNIPAKPRQTVYLGVEGFWLNRNYHVPVTNPSDYAISKYLVSRNAFHQAVDLVREAHYIGTERWHETRVGRACTIGRIFPSINWRLDGSRVWSWELDPKKYAAFSETPYTGDLVTWRNGYYLDWTQLDPRRLAVLRQALALAQARGWRVVGFAPPEPKRFLRLLDTDPRLSRQWHAYLRLMPRLFARYGGVWAGFPAQCGDRHFPDGFHTDAACSELVHERLDEAARGLH